MDQHRGNRRKAADTSDRDISRDGCSKNLWPVFRPDGIRPPWFFAAANALAVVIVIAFAASITGLLALALWSINATRDVLASLTPGCAMSIDTGSWWVKVLCAGLAGIDLWHFWTSIPMLVVEMRRKVEDEDL